jgi:hypothetical protein
MLLVLPLPPPLISLVCWNAEEAEDTAFLLYSLWFGETTALIAVI